MKIKFQTILNIFFASAALGVGISYNKLYFFHLMAIIVIAAYIYLIIKKRKISLKKFPTAYHYFFYIWFIWYLISILWSQNFVYSLQYLFYIAIGSFLSLSIIYYVDKKDKLQKVIKYTSVVFIFEIILSIIEKTGIFRWPISPYSQYCVLFGREMGIGSNLNEASLKYIYSLPTGFQWNPNNLAVAMVIIFPFFLFLKNRIVKYTGLLSIVLVIIATGSRGCIFALAILLLLYFILFFNKKLLLSLISILFFLFSSFLIFFSEYHLETNIENQKLYEAANAINVVDKYLATMAANLSTANNSESSVSKTDSISSRARLIVNGLIAVKQSYGLGEGAGGSISVQENADIKAGNLKSMHNFWIELLVDSGIVFTVLFFLWYLFVTMELYKFSRYKFDYKMKYYSSACSLSMMGFLVAAVSASSVIYFLPMWLLYGFSIAVLNNYKRLLNQ